jgi:hypothetical protein
MVRERAKEERKLMLSCRKEKKLAKAKNQKSLARVLALKEIEHEKYSELLSTQASEMFFGSAHFLWRKCSCTDK